MTGYDPFPSASIDGRRKKFMQRESELRRSHHAQRLDRVRKTKLLFCPTLAITHVDPTFNGNVRKTNSATPTANICKENKTAEQSSVFANQTQDHETKTIKLFGEAEMLCDILESAIGRADFTGLSLAIELSLKVADEINVSRTVFNQQSHSLKPPDKATPTIAAFTGLVNHEKTLVTLSEIVAAEPPEPKCVGHVKSYAFSPAHDALMCVIENDEGKYLYPALKLDHIPRVGDNISISWEANAGTVEPYDRSRDQDTSRKIKVGS